MWKAPKRPKNQITQPLNDGIIQIFEVTDAAEPGDKPVKKLELKESLRYAQRTAGIGRIYAAMQAGASIDLVVRCPRRAGVSTQDIGIMGGVQYEISLIQYPIDIYPAVMDLTLTRLEQAYGFKTD